MKKFIRNILLHLDLILAPIVYISSLFLRKIRMIGIKDLSFCRRALSRAKVFPIVKHYQEPYVDSTMLKRKSDEVRDLPGIDWNDKEQLDFLNHLTFADELNNLYEPEIGELSFHFNNGYFESGDAEYLYNIVRLKKPIRVFEIGSGYSTLIAMRAIKNNSQEMSNYKCKHLCIEPYENPWLEKTGVIVLRQRVESIDKVIFKELERDDILFIDSSHVIRPQGDVLFEYLEVLPLLKPGVIVHIHDIFSPRDYPKGWVIDEGRLWNDQYLLEAFLSCNKEWKIIGALNYLYHKYYQELKKHCLFLTNEREPVSFYIQKVQSQ